MYLPNKIFQFVSNETHGPPPHNKAFATNYRACESLHFHNQAIATSIVLLTKVLIVNGTRNYTNLISNLYTEHIK